MDVRLSTEQQALRDSAAQVVDRLGVRTVRQLDDAERAAKLDAADRGRRLAGAAGRVRRGRSVGARPSRSRSSPRSSAAAWPTRRSPDRPWRPICAGSSVRRPPPIARPSCSTGTRRPRGRRAGDDLVVPAVAVDAPGECGRDCSSWPRARWRRIPLAGDRVGGRPDPSVGAGRATVSCRNDSPVRIRALDADAHATVDRPRSRAHLCRPRRRDARRHRACDGLRRRTAPVRRAGRILPGRAAPARRRAGRDRRRFQRHAARRLGGGRARHRRTRSRPVPSPRRTAPGPRAPCARPRSRCTVASATPGSASRTSTCGAALRLDRRARRRRAVARHGCSRTTGSETRMDFADSPAEAEFRHRLRTWLEREQPRACRRPRPTTTTGTVRRRGTSRCTTPGSSGSPGRPRSVATGLPTTFDAIVDDELAAAGAPPRPSLGYLVQGILEHGNDDIQTPVPARHRQRSRPLVPGLQRAGRRFGSGVAPHACRPRRRRVRPHRPQGVDELLGRRRLVHGARAHRPHGREAQGHLRVRDPDGPARGRAAAAAHDQRRHQGVRRGPLRRRPRPRREHDR